MAGRERAARQMARVPFIALTYFVLLLLYEVLVALSGTEGLSFRIGFLVPFILIFAVSAAGVWRRTRWGFVLGGVCSASVVLFGLPFNIPIFVSSADALFLAVWTGELALIVVAASIISSRLSERPRGPSPNVSVG